MAEVHILQWTVMFAGALWLTAKWLLEQPAQRWRHLTAGIAATLMWIPVAYTANNLGDVAPDGSTTVFGSSAMAGVATFMVVVCVGGLVVGLLLWVESTTDAASAELPSQMRRGRG